MQLTKESMASSAQVFDSANISIRFSVWQLENLLKSIVPPVDRDRRVWHLLKLQIKIIIYTFAINKIINKKMVVCNISIGSFVFYVAIQSIANVNAESEQEICYQSYMYMYVLTWKFAQVPM